MPDNYAEWEQEAAAGRWWFRRADPAADLRGCVKEYWEVEGALRPVGAVELVGPEVARTANSIVDLQSILGPAGDALVESARAGATPEARFAVLETFLHERPTTVQIPGFVRAAARRIEETHGGVRVSTLHREYGVSRKHLAVTFKRVFGVTPRGYAKLLRFAWTVEQLRTPGPVDWPRLAVEAGYSDKSHLGRDFRCIGGRAATLFLAQLTPDGIALWDDVG
jgi:AraC-like DNA-binding protein